MLYNDNCKPAQTNFRFRKVLFSWNIPRFHDGNESAFFGTVCRSVHMRQGIPVKCDIIRQNPYFMQNG